MVDFPVVPFVPGVPAVARAIGSLIGLQDVLLATDVFSFIGLLNNPQWGIFLNGAPVVLADCVVSFSYKQEWIISDYQVEQGGFETYDKVDRPFDVRVRYSAGGTQSNRQALLDSITAIASDLNFYDVVTPEASYSSANITHYDYSRTSENGAGILMVEVFLTEVRVVNTTYASNSGNNPQIDNAKDPSASSFSATGQVQTSDLSSQQAINSGFSSQSFQNFGNWGVG